MRGIDEILNEVGDGDTANHQQPEEDTEESRAAMKRKYQQENEQLKIEKGEIAIHLEKIQAMLRI